MAVISGAQKEGGKMFEASVFIMVGIMIFFFGWGVGMNREKRISEKKLKLMRRWISTKANDRANTHV